MAYTLSRKCNGCQECKCCGRDQEYQKRYYCDVCGQETEDLYETQNGQECIDCIMERECELHKEPEEGVCGCCGDYCFTLYNFVGILVCRECFEDFVKETLERVDVDG